MTIMYGARPSKTASLNFMGNASWDAIDTQANGQSRNKAYSLKHAGCATLLAMKNLPHHLATLLTTAWVGGLWATGYLAVPVLFYAQPDRQLAGMLAGHMFSLVGYLGTVCGVYLLGYRFVMSGKGAWRQPLFWIVAAMLLFTLVIQCGFQPIMNGLKAQALPLDVMHSAFAERFSMLHHLSSTIYTIESLLGIFLVIKTRQA
jgi:Domain of unknown function (DUF4149)